MRYGNFVSKWHKTAGTALLTVFALWMVVAIGIVGSAILDVSFGLGWGYSRRDALLGVPFILGGCVVMGLIWGIYRLVGRINIAIFGVDRRSGREP